MTPLHHAALKNQLEAAKMLVKNGADVNERGFQDALKGKGNYGRGLEID